MTDVTGFGLLGHLLEVCRASGVRARVHFEAVPVLPTALGFAREGHGPGAIERNWASYGAEVALDTALPSWAPRLLCDAQTSGGLLLACAPGTAPAVLEHFRAEGFAQAAVIGELHAGPAAVAVV